MEKEKRVEFLKSRIRDIPDFPVEGILFRDLTPLWRDPEAFKVAVELLLEPFRNSEIDVVVAPEARGFVFGSVMAYLLGAGFAPVRKPGKLPAEKESVMYELEYGQNTLEIHRDAISSGERVLIVDDLLATGGTAEAIVKLVEKLGGKVAGIAFLVELTFLNGRERLSPHFVHTVIKY